MTMFRPKTPAWQLLLRYTPLLLMLVIQVLPIAAVALTSAKTTSSVLSHGPFAGAGWTSANYRLVVGQGPFLSYFATSAVVACGSTVLSVMTATAAAYALARWRFRGRNLVAVSFVVARLLPPVALALPVFLLLSRVHAVDTVLGLILAHTTFNLPFAVWLLLPAFTGLPHDYAEAAAMDGCTPWLTFRLVMLPLAWPAILTAAVFCALASWNDFLFSLILAGGRTKTAALAVNGFMTSFGPEWGPLTAASMLMLAPAFVLALFVQRQLVAGLTAGGVKH